MRVTIGIEPYAKTSTVSISRSTVQNSPNPQTPEKMREVLDRLQANGKHLLGLINDVLDLSKIEAGELTLDLADYSLIEVVQTVFTAASRSQPERSAP